MGRPNASFSNAVFQLAAALSAALIVYGFATFAGASGLAAALAGAAAGGWTLGRIRRRASA